MSLVTVPLSSLILKQSVDLCLRSKTPTPYTYLKEEHWKQGAQAFWLPQLQVVLIDLEKGDDKSVIVPIDLVRSMEFALDGPELLNELEAKRWDGVPVPPKPATPVLSGGPVAAAKAAVAAEVEKAPEPAKEDLGRATLKEEMDEAEAEAYEAGSRGKLVIP